jgi:hypothetical protein
MLTRVRMNYKQEMVQQLSHKKETVLPQRKKEMVLPLRRKKEMATHPLRPVVKLTRGKLKARGEIDEGEVNEEVLRRYEMEADEDECGLEEDSSDDEDDPLVPRDCDKYNFSQLSVNPGENVSWEYRDNKVSIGTMYKSTVEVKDAVKRWATLTPQREFRVVKSSPHIYDV